ncbi:hypothetical protein CRV00_04290 [Malaciobacter molluscorum]|uniref:hypothetical protein n=1 Tax=Malaciobacter molluscorum TaxID=1032072 RepID=UPI00100A9610|nr:hypothetical protein [Malaciobacter molluscorum]RXJ95668.1 hypothetical protein CRV00_04290 [Malaciobacter molluscorum]
MIISSHRTSNLNLSAPTSNLMKKHISSNIISESSKTQKEDKTDSIVPKKIEGDYSTYSIRELSQLSYSELKEHYNEIKKVLEEKLKAAKDVFYSDSFKNYQKRLALTDQSAERRVGTKDFDVHMQEMVKFLNKDKITNEMLDKEYGQITYENVEAQELLNFKDKFKIVNFFDNDEINKAIFDKYQDNAQIYYEEPQVSDLDGEKWGFNSANANKIQGTSLNSILQSVRDAKESIAAHGLPVKTNNPFVDYSSGYYIHEDKITIAGKTFSLDDVHKSAYAYKSEEKIPNETDYSSYTIKELRQLPFEEVKQNYDEILKVVKDAFKNGSDLSEEDKRDLLALKAQLDAVNYTDNDDINQAYYNRLKGIDDPKVLVWSNSEIIKKMDDLQKGNIDSLIINNSTFSSNEINAKQKEEDKKEDTKIKEHEKEKSQVDLDSLINNVSRMAFKVSNTSENTYNKELIESYSKFITQYNEVKNSIVN